VTIKLASVVPVWVLAVIGSILVALFSPQDEYFTWLQIVFAFATIATFCIQVFAPSKEGLVLRMFASLGGAVLILALATGILGLISLQ